MNPYGNSPLSAYILFETKDACKVTMTVVGKTKETDITAEFEKTKKHRIPVVGLYPNAKNKVHLSCVDKNGKKKTKTVIIQTKELPKELKDAVKVEKKGKASAYALNYSFRSNDKISICLRRGGRYPLVYYDDDRFLRRISACGQTADLSDG